MRRGGERRFSLDNIVMPNIWSVLRWSALALGVLVNLWALWVMLSEIGKELFRVGQLPDVSTDMGLLGWFRHAVTFGWLPKDALHIRLSRKIIFAAGNAAFLVVILNFYARGNRRLAIATGVLVVVTLALLFSPAVGSL